MMDKFTFDRHGYKTSIEASPQTSVAAAFKDIIQGTDMQDGAWGFYNQSGDIEPDTPIGCFKDRVIFVKPI